MDYNEFAEKFKAQNPDYADRDNKTLAEALVKKHPYYADKVTFDDSKDFAANREAIEPGVMGDTVPVEQKLINNTNAALGGATLPRAAVELGALAGKGLSSAAEAIKSLAPNPSLKALGASTSQLGTPAAQSMAEAAKAYGTTAQPELGQLVAKAGQSAEEGLSTSAPQASIFEKPVIQGAANSPKQMLGLIEEHNKQIGEAIGNTLKGLDQSGVKLDPKPIIKQAESMLERDAEGNIMTTGAQGDKNEAIKEALSSLSDYSKGKPISWKEANRIKGMLQDSGNYAAKRYQDSNEAYKAVAGLIKNGIDDQATNILKETGGNIQDFQNLRSAYGKTSVLKQMLTKSAGKEMMQPSTTEQVISGIKHSLPYVGGYGVLHETLKHLGF